MASEAWYLGVLHRDSCLTLRQPSLSFVLQTNLWLTISQMSRQGQFPRKRKPAKSSPRKKPSESICRPSRRLPRPSSCLRCRPVVLRLRLPLPRLAFRHRLRPLRLPGQAVLLRFLPPLRVPRRQRPLVLRPSSPMCPRSAHWIPFSPLPPPLSHWPPLGQRFG